jgi:hypothetical protein
MDQASHKRKKATATAVSKVSSQISGPDRQGSGSSTPLRSRRRGRGLPNMRVSRVRVIRRRRVRVLLAPIITASRASRTDLGRVISLTKQS